jgi:hypothetical protein
LRRVPCPFHTHSTPIPFGSVIVYYSLKFFDITLPKLPKRKACAEIGGLMENNVIAYYPLKFFDVTLPKLPKSKACVEIGGLMENNSFSENFNCRIL